MEIGLSPRRLSLTAWPTEACRSSMTKLCSRETTAGATLPSSLLLPRSNAGSCNSCTWSLDCRVSTCAGFRCRSSPPCSRSPGPSRRTHQPCRSLMDVDETCVFGFANWACRVAVALHTLRSFALTTPSRLVLHPLIPMSRRAGRKRKEDAIPIAQDDHDDRKDDKRVIASLDVLLGRCWSAPFSAEQACSFCRRVVISSLCCSCRPFASPSCRH